MQRFMIMHPATGKETEVIVAADVQRYLDEIPRTIALRKIIERLDRIESLLLKQPSATGDGVEGE